jgi:hypothetical protein
MFSVRADYVLGVGSKKIAEGDHATPFYTVIFEHMKVMGTRTPGATPEKKPVWKFRRSWEVGSQSQTTAIREHRLLAALAR